jgi:G:T-mismatch repair DNA endonuclease (very short patch repair protein)
MDRETKRKYWFNDKCRESIAKRTKLRYKIIQRKIGKNMNREEKKLMQSLEEKKDFI